MLIEKTMCSTIHSLIGSSNKILPYCDDQRDLANRFVSFFDQKISKIRGVLDQKEQGLQNLSVVQSVEKHECETDLVCQCYSIRH